MANNTRGCKMTGLKAAVRASKGLAPIGRISHYNIKIGYDTVDGQVIYSEHVGDSWPAYAHESIIHICILDHPTTTRELADVITRRVTEYTLMRQNENGLHGLPPTQTVTAPDETPTRE